MLTGIAHTLVSQNVLEHVPSIKKKSSIYELRVFGKYNVLKIMNFFYNDSLFYLTRKYNTFCIVKNLECNNKYPKRWIDNKKCYICGDKQSNKFIVWHGHDQYWGRVFCNKHYQQLYKNGKIDDPTPYKKTKILCLNNGMLFNTKKEAARCRII